MNITNPDRAPPPYLWSNAELAAWGLRPALFESETTKAERAKNRKPVFEWGCEISIRLERDKRLSDYYPMEFQQQYTANRLHVFISDAFRHFLLDEIFARLIMPHPVIAALSPLVPLEPCNPEAPCANAQVGGCPQYGCLLREDDPLEDLNAVMWLRPIFDSSSQRFLLANVTFESFAYGWSEAENLSEWFEEPPLAPRNYLVIKQPRPNWLSFEFAFWQDLSPLRLFISHP